MAWDTYLGGVVEGILGGVAGWEVEGAKNEDNAKTLSTQVAQT